MSQVSALPVRTHRKLIVLAIVKQHYIDHGVSPTISEIAGAMAVSKTRVQSLVRRLEHDGLVKRVRGARRGIMLANRAKQVSTLDALLQLQGEGWLVNLGRLELVAPPCPELTLPLRPQLDHVPPSHGVDHHGRTRG